MVGLAKVEFWDEWEGKVVTSYLAESNCEKYRDIMESVVQYFGDDNIISATLHILNKELEISKEEYERQLMDLA